MSYNRKSEANKSSNNNVDSHVTGVSLVVAFNMDQLYPLFVLYVADVVSVKGGYGSEHPFPGDTDRGRIAIGLEGILSVWYGYVYSSCWAVVDCGGKG